MHTPANGGGDVDQGIQRKPRYAPAQQVIDARLSDAAVRRSFRLLPTIGFDDGRNLAHEFGSGAKVCGLLGGIGQCIPHRSEEHTSELQSLMRISYAVFCLT